MGSWVKGKSRELDKGKGGKLGKGEGWGGR